MLKILVKLFGDFRYLLPSESEASSTWVDLNEGAEIAEILKYFGISGEQPMMIILNHRAARWNQTLNDGDIVAIFPPLSGG